MIEGPWDAFQSWYEKLERGRNGLPYKGHVAGGLILLENLRDEFALDIRAHRTANQGQLRNAGGPSLARILARYGETRPFLSEGGRTSRGVLGEVESLLDALRDADAASLSPDERVGFLDRCQAFLASRVRDYHNQERLTIAVSQGDTAWATIHRLLSVARTTGKEAAVAEYIVGAKLQLRFPHLIVRNTSYSTSDVQSGESGDFLVGNTVFHVTISPTPGLYTKCKGNLDQGHRVYLIVPDSLVVGARQNADSTSANRISVQSIESFVAQNIDELAEFGERQFMEALAQLISTYNKRVDSVESDKSLLIKPPANIAEWMSKQEVDAASLVGIPEESVDDFEQFE